MNLLLAPDSFKGCLTSREVCAALTSGINAVDKDINILQFPSSDGGEGFCDCMINIFGGKYVEREVAYPLGNKGKASFVYEPYSSAAFIELASCAGLSLVPPEKRNILESGTYGVGELIASAVELGAKHIVVGLGGSATNDCGIGMLSALGMRFYDEERNVLPPVAASLMRIASFDKGEMIDLSNIRFTAACDVKNPLCGKDGAAEVFSRQKGATDDEVAMLDRAACFFAALLGIDHDLSGCGAAGGVGAALIGLLGAEYVSGASLLVSSDAFIDAMQRADLVITGEGNTDAQTAFGKLVSVVVKSAKRYGVPSVVISGGLSDGYEDVLALGAKACYSLTDEAHDREYCIKHASELLSEKIREILA